jgi:hypothetical protein
MRTVRRAMISKWKIKKWSKHKSRRINGSGKDQGLEMCAPDQGFRCLEPGPRGTWLMGWNTPCLTYDHILNCFT